MLRFEIVKLKFFEKRSPDRVSARSPWWGFVMTGKTGVGRSESFF